MIIAYKKWLRTKVMGLFKEMNRVYNLIFTLYCRHCIKSIQKIQFSSVTQLCPILSDSMEGSTPGFPVHHQLPELAQIHLHRVGDTIQPSDPVSPSPAFNFPGIRVFPVSQFFASGGQSIGVSASASVFPMNNQDWFPLGLIGLISLQSKGLSSLL